MDTTRLNAVLDWMKTTDLVEVAFKSAGEGFSLSASGAAALAGPILTPRLVPIVSESVGVFQWNEPGRARKAEEGTSVSSGDALGIIVSGSGAACAVKAPCAGKIVKCLAEAGQAVDYGRPLFLIELPSQGD